MTPSLFGSTVRPADHDPADLQRAARLGPRIRLGTSSWTFPGWEGLVWGHPTTDAQLAEEGLSAYAAHPLLGCVGVDRTYYRPVDARTFARWAAAVPEDFRFVVKGSRQLTTPWDTAGRWLDPTFAADAVIAPMLDGLGERAGPLVLQFPPLDPAQVGGPDAFADKLHRFLDHLPRARPPVAVEIRTRALYTRRYASALADQGASHVVSVYPGLPLVPTQGRLDLATGAHHLVVRWMLRPNLAYREAKAAFAPFNRTLAPDVASRDGIAEVVRAARAADRPAWIIINNKAEGSAPLSARALADAIAGA